MKASAHGTAEGRQQHKRRGEQPCDDCRRAYNLDLAQRRYTDPEWRDRQNLRRRVRNEALNRFAALDRVGFEIVHQQVANEMGFDTDA